MELTQQYPRRGEELLYPMMLIAAIAVIVFSFLGIASISGWMPHAIVGASTAPVVETAGKIPGMEVAPGFQCAECGVIESVREIERAGSPLVFPQNTMSQPTGI